jgi:exosortase/archaeosortase family protein
MAITTPTTRYLVFYTAIFAITLWVFYNVPSGWIESLTAQTATVALNLFGHVASWQQADGFTTMTLIGQHLVTVSIIRECTALNVLGVMTGLILPLKASPLKRALGIGISSLLLFTLNIPRIALTVYLTSYDTWPFTLISDRGLETYHYPISFAFGVIGVAITVLAVSRWATPELADTLLGFVDKILSLGRKGGANTRVSLGST